MMYKMAENSRELALRRASTLPKKNCLRRWASGGSVRLRHLRSDCPINARFLQESLLPALLYTLHPDHEMHLVGRYGRI